MKWMYTDNLRDASEFDFQSWRGVPGDRIIGTAGLTEKALRFLVPEPKSFLLQESVG